MLLEDGRRVRPSFFVALFDKSSRMTMSQQSIQLWQAAEAALRAGDLARASRLYAELTQVVELSPHAHLRLSLLADGQRSVRDATAHALRAMGAASLDPDLLTMLGKRLLVLGEVRLARACAFTLLQSTKPEAEHCAELGKMMSDHMEVDISLPLLEKAAALGLGNSSAIRYLLGLNAMYAGDMARSTRELHRSIELDPGFHLAYWTLAKLGDPEGREVRTAALSALLSSMPDDHPNLPILGYSLFHELDAMDEVDRAWPILAMAMRRRRSQVRHDPDREDALHDSAVAAWRDLSTLPVSQAEDEAMPIFVLGMPRTGTTLIDRELACSTGAVSAGELRDLLVQMRWVTDLPGPWSLDEPLIDGLQKASMSELGRHYLEQTRWRAGVAHLYIDKWPDNYKVAGWIPKAMPGARIVSVHRDPMDACFSNLKEWFAGVYGYSYDQQETARQYVRYHRMMDAFYDLQPSMSARVRYEDMVLSSNDAIAGLVTALNLPNMGSQEKERPAGPVRTASAVQVREGIHKRGLGGWKRYAKHLAPMQDALAKAGFPAESGAATA